MEETVPPRRTTFVQASNVAWVPTASTATSTPTSPVRDMISAAASFSLALMTTLAPSFFDISSRSGTASTAMIRPQPRARAPAGGGAEARGPVGEDGDGVAEPSPSPVDGAEAGRYDVRGQDGVLVGDA